MNERNMMTKSGTSKLALLRQNKGVKGQNVDIEKAINGFASSIDTRTMMAEVARNSAIVNFIIDCSTSMYGTSQVIANEINEFARRQAVKIYTTILSLTVFNEEALTEFTKQNVRQFSPIFPWECSGGTNIYDALFSAITPITKADAKHKLHLIITDGQNGHSQHTKEQVQRLITDRIKCGEHIFLLYNDYEQDSSKSYAESLGIEADNAVNFNREGDGIKIIFQAIEDLLEGIRNKGVVPKDWAKAIAAHALNPLGIKAREIKYIE